MAQTQNLAPNYKDNSMAKSSKENFGSAAQKEQNTQNDHSIEGYIPANFRNFQTKDVSKLQKYERDTYFKDLNRSRTEAMKSVDLVVFLLSRGGNTNVQRSGQEAIVTNQFGKFNVIKARDDKNTFLFKNWYDGNSGNIMQYLQLYEGYGDIHRADVMNRIYNELKNFQPGEFVNESFISAPKNTADLSFQPLKNWQYLSSRGIQDNTLSHPKYQDAIYNKITRSKSGNFNNIAFPIRNFSGEITSFEMKNKGFSSITKGGVLTESLWVSNINQNSVGKRQINIGEAVIDLLSYNQLHPEKLSHSVDISTIGRLSNSQLPIIQKYIDLIKPSHINLVNDRDVAGLGFDLQLMAGLARPGQTPEERIQVSLFKDPLQRNYDKISFELKSNTDKGLSKQIVMDRLYEIGKDIKEMGDIEVNNLKYAQEGIAKFQIRFHHNHQNEKNLMKVFEKHFNQDQFFQIDKPKGLNVNQEPAKDWNEKLCANLGISKDAFANNFNPGLKAQNKVSNDVEAEISFQTGGVVSGGQGISRTVNAPGRGNDDSEKMKNESNKRFDEVKIEDKIVEKPVYQDVYIEKIQNGGVSFERLDTQNKSVKSGKQSVAKSEGVQKESESGISSANKNKKVIVEVIKKKNARKAMPDVREKKKSISKSRGRGLGL